MTTRKEFLGKLLPAIAVVPLIKPSEAKEVRPNWMTERFQCRECLLIQLVSVKKMARGKAAIISVQQVHAIWCSHFSKEIVSFEL